MHVLGLTGPNTTKGTAYSWAIGERAETPTLHMLKEKYTTWHLQLDLPASQTRAIQQGLRRHSKLGEAWSGNAVAARVYA